MRRYPYDEVERSRVVNEALSWVGTPYELNANLKGVGIDCARFLICVFDGVGLVSYFDIGVHKPDFNLHRGEEIYLRELEKYCDPVPGREPLPGDIVVFKMGRIHSHGAIVLDWPMVVHARADAGVSRADATTEYAGRPFKLYKLKGWD